MRGSEASAGAHRGTGEDAPGGNRGGVAACKLMQAAHQMRRSLVNMAEVTAPMRELLEELLKGAYGTGGLRPAKVKREEDWK